MTTAYQQYGALYTKVRALYGKQLDRDAVRALSAMRSAGDIADALRARPGWRRAVSALPPEVDFATLERALGDRLMVEYGALLHYIPQTDRAIAAFPLLLAEQACLLAALRCVRVGRPVDGEALPPLPRGSRLSHDALHGQTSVEGIAEAAARTLYAAPMRKMALSDEIPDEVTAESILQGMYFSALLARIDKHYSGATRAQLRQVFGAQLDLYNLMHILRLKRFSADSGRIISTLLPRRHHLQPGVLQALVAAPDDESLLAALQRTAYGDFFAGTQAAEAEETCRRALYALHLHALQTQPPGVCTLVSYYYLKELEIKALITAVESARYGAPYHDSFAQLLREGG